MTQQRMYSQQEQLEWLRTTTGVTWQPSSSTYAINCHKGSLLGRPVMIMPAGENTSAVNYYLTKTGFCSWSEVIAKGLIKLRDEKLWEILPALKVDLNNLPAITIVRPIKRINKWLVVTYQLDGDLILQHIASDSKVTTNAHFSNFHVNASMGLNNFVNTLKVNIDFNVTPGQQIIEKIGIGYSINNKDTVWNTSLKINPDLSFEAGANPTPIETIVAPWRVEGQLGFNMTGRFEDNKPTDLPADAIVLEDLEGEEATELSLSQRIGIGVVGIGSGALYIIASGRKRNLKGIREGLAIMGSSWHTATN